MQDTRALAFVVDDDVDFCRVASRWLEADQMHVRTYQHANQLLESLASSLPDVVCLDLGLPDMDGMSALQAVRQSHRTVPVIIVTGDQSVGAAVAAMRAGAYDYIVKPADRLKVVTCVRNAVERHRLSTRLCQLEHQMFQPRTAGFVGRSEKMQAVLRQVHKVAASDITVFVRGESGTGKELVARALHDLGARRDGPFIAVNCAAIPETLQDTELFGHEKGAFTGATQSRAGRFEQAHGGTLLLDEVGELGQALQAKLLRVLQERSFQRVGGQRTISVDFRLVTATHRDLAALVKSGQFREDLYFRVAVFELELPPLRERADDLPLLVDALLARATLEQKCVQHTLEPAAAEILERYHWPGNVRELQNVLRTAMVNAEGGVIRAEDLPRRVREVDARAPASAASFESMSHDAPPASAVACSRTPSLPLDTELHTMTLAELERWAIRSRMQVAGGDVAEVARHLGIGRTTLYRKLKQYSQR